MRIVNFIVLGLFGTFFVSSIGGLFIGFFSFIYRKGVINIDRIDFYIILAYVVGPVGLAVGSGMLWFFIEYFFDLKKSRYLLPSMPLFYVSAHFVYFLENTTFSMLIDGVVIFVSAILSRYYFERKNKNRK